MSRYLPLRPNLEFLKKQAKDLLNDMQRRDPASKLSDAQHEIAQQYGFPSWPKLKAHVDSLSSLVACTVAASKAGEDVEVVHTEETLPGDVRHFG